MKTLEDMTPEELLASRIAHYLETLPDRSLATLVAGYHKDLYDGMLTVLTDQNLTLNLAIRTAVDKDSGRLAMALAVLLKGLRVTLSASFPATSAPVSGGTASVPLTTITGSCTLTGPA